MLCEASGHWKLMRLNTPSQEPSAITRMFTCLHTLARSARYTTTKARHAAETDQTGRHQAIALTSATATIDEERSSVSSTGRATYCDHPLAELGVVRVLAQGTTLVDPRRSVRNRMWEWWFQSQGDRNDIRGRTREGHWWSTRRTSNTAVVTVMTT
jgi:hypothetical protein